MKADIWIIETTLEQEDQANELAKQAVESGLAACAQVQDPITSHYVWQGKCERSREVRLTFKLAEKTKQSFIKWLLDQHPYTCPEIISWPAESSNPEYTRWVLGE